MKPCGKSKEKEISVNIKLNPYIRGVGYRIIYWREREGEEEEICREMKRQRVRETVIDGLAQNGPSGSSLHSPFTGA